jgi:hypothetical protein
MITIRIISCCTPPSLPGKILLLTCNSLTTGFLSAQNQRSIGLGLLRTAQDMLSAAYGKIMALPLSLLATTAFPSVPFRPEFNSAGTSLLTAFLCLLVLPSNSPLLISTAPSRSTPWRRQICALSSCPTPCKFLLSRAGIWNNSVLSFSTT